MASQHIAVMTSEVIQVLQPKAGGLYLDGTLGGGTHARALLNASMPSGRVMSLDVDRKALAAAKEMFAAYGDRWIGVENNFRNLDKASADYGFAPIDGVLLDLGFSSDELADAARGLSFQKDGPLDMRLGPKSNEDGMTAAEIVNTWSEDDLAKLLETFGEEPHAHRIAKHIVEARKAARIIGTLDLAAVVTKAINRRPGDKIHSATRTFQALRIAVNDELEALKDAIKAAENVLAPGGRLAIITFHSLEDRIVKNAFASGLWEAAIEKPLKPGAEEVAENPRARSAKLRVAVRR
jgi:16S rRNA (cytosine1402-N4)-methyltransferase